MDKAMFFDYYFNEAEVNSIMIMDGKGTVLDVNRAFTNNFGYRKEELEGKNFDVLFVQTDKEKNKPRLELETVLSQSHSHDESYVVDKGGHAIWYTGESILAKDGDGEKYIIKDTVNLQAKRQLQLFLKETEELLERIFESFRDIPMMVLDGSMKVEKVNRAFMLLFELNEVPQSGSRLADLNHPFWGNDGLKNELRQILMTNQPIKNKEYRFETKTGRQKRVKIDQGLLKKAETKEDRYFLFWKSYRVKLNPALDCLACSYFRATEYQ